MARLAIGNDAADDAGDGAGDAENGVERRRDQRRKAVEGLLDNSRPFFQGIVHVINCSEHLAGRGKPLRDIFGVVVPPMLLDEEAMLPRSVEVKCGNWYSFHWVDLAHDYCYATRPVQAYFCVLGAFAVEGKRDTKANVNRCASASRITKRSASCSPGMHISGTRKTPRTSGRHRAWSHSSFVHEPARTTASQSNTQ